MITLRSRYLDTWVTFSEEPVTDACRQAWSAFLRIPCPTQHVIYGKPSYSFIARSRYLDSGYDALLSFPVVMLCVPEPSSLFQFFGTVLVSSSPLHFSVASSDEYLTPDRGFYLFFFPLSTKTDIPVTVS